MGDVSRAVDGEFEGFFKSLVDSECSQKSRLESGLQPVLSDLRKKKKISIHHNLLPNEQQLLINSYPEFHLQFTCEVFHQHAFAAASRRLELEVLLLRLSLDGCLSPFEGYDDLVCDIGGDFALHLKKGDGIHSCCPLIDVRDAQRYSTRMENLRRFFHCNQSSVFDLSLRNRIVSFLRKDIDTVSKYYCDSLAQECVRTARYGLSIHSCYDITLSQFAQIMIRKNMTEIYGTFIYSDQIFLGDEGFIAGVDCFFTVNHKKDTIEFSFRDDPSLTYTHSYKNYLALLTLNSFKDVSGKNTFVIELLENRAGIQFFKISRLNIPYNYPMMSKFLWLPSLNGKTKVKFFDLDQNQLAAGNFNKILKPVVFYVDTNVIDKVASHAYASTETKFRPVEIFGFLLAYNGRIFFGSDVCVRFKQLPFEQAVLLANAVYLYVYSRKYDIGKIDQLLIAAIKHDRELAEASLFGKLKKNKFDYPSSYGTGHSYCRLVRALAAPFHRLFYWMKKSKYDVKEFLDDNCKFVKCESSVQSFCMKVFAANSKSEVCSIQYHMSGIIEEERASRIKEKISELFSEYCLFDEHRLVHFNEVVPIMSRVTVKPNFSVPVKLVERLNSLLHGPDSLDFSVLRKKNSKVVSSSFVGDTLFVGGSFDFVNDCEVKGKKIVIGLDSGLKGATVLECQSIVNDAVNVIASLSLSNVVLCECENLDSLLLPLYNQCTRSKVKFFSGYWGFNDYNYAFLCMFSGGLTADLFFLGKPVNFPFDTSEGDSFVTASSSSEVEFVSVDDDEIVSCYSVIGVPPEKRCEIWAKYLTDTGCSCRVVDETTVSQVKLDVDRSKFCHDKTACLNFVCKVLSFFPDANYFQGFHDVCAIFYSVAGWDLGLQFAYSFVKKIYWKFLECEMSENLEFMRDCILMLAIQDLAAHKLIVEYDEFSGLFLGFFLSLGIYVERDLEMCKKIFDFFVIMPAGVVPFFYSSYLKYLFAEYNICDTDRLRVCLSSDLCIDWSEVLHYARSVFLSGNRDVHNRMFVKPVVHIGVSTPLTVPESILSEPEREGIDGVIRFFSVSDECQKLVSLFCKSLLNCEGVKRKGKWGTRFEYLYSPYGYKYGNVETVPMSAYIPAFFSRFVDLSFYNSLLVVYYPEGVDGLNFHKDDEECMASPRVFTLSCGAACQLLLRDEKKKIYEYELTSEEGYELLSQDKFFHAVRVKGARFALTFRRRVVEGVKLSALPLELVPSHFDCTLGPDFVSDLDNVVFERVRKNFDNVESCVVSRGEFKISEIFDLLGDLVLEFSSFVDLCAAPGGWTFFLSSRGRVFSYALPGTHVAVGNPEYVDIFELDLLPEVDLVVADGSPVEGFSHDLEKTYKLIDREIDLALPLLVRGKYLLIKLYIGDGILYHLKRLRNFKIFRLFRPTATVAISREVYLFVGGGLGGNHSEKFAYNACCEHLINARQCFMMVKDGAILERKILKVEEHVLDLGGQGDCLFYCLTGDNFAAASALRRYIRDNRPPESEVDVPGYSVAEVDEECAADGVHAGTSVIIAFCYLFHSNVCVYDTVTRKCLFKLDRLMYPFYDIKLAFFGAHYQRFVHESVNDLYLRPFVFDTINLEILFFQLLKIVYKNDDFVFFNLMAKQCFNVSCKCYGGLADIFLKSKKFLVFFNTSVFSVQDLVDFGVKRGFNCSFLCLPQLTRTGYCVIEFYYSPIKMRPVDYEAAWNRCLNHAKICIECLKGLSYNYPMYHHFDRTYYYCNIGEVVSIVQNLDDAQLVFRLVPVGKNLLEYRELVDCGDVIDVPIRLTSKGVLTLDEGQLKHLTKLFKDFFSFTGSVKTVGIINCGLYDVSFFVKILKNFSSKIFVNSDNIAGAVKGLNFSPEFVVNTDDLSYIKNSMVEAREYYKAYGSAIVSKLTPLHSQYLRLVANIKGGDTFNIRPDYALIDMGLGTYVVPPKDGGGPYSFAFDGHDLVDISGAWNEGCDKKKYYAANCSWLKPGVFSGLFSVCADTKLINSQRIFSRMKQYDLSGDFAFPATINLIEGVPGCGKTKYIIDNHKFSATDCRHVVLTSSREAVEDLRRRVAKKFSLDPGDKILQKRYRTVDSFLINFDGDEVHTLWIDEGLMKHFGDLLWCVFISGCAVVNIIGDRAQIPFHNRLAGVDLKYTLPSLTPARMNVKFLSTTYRCPVDVAVLLSRLQVYSERVVSTSNVERSLRVVAISSIFDIRNLAKDSVLLTFTRDDKQKLLRDGHLRVFTINEFQGSQAENIVLVRENPKPLPLFDSLSHLLVAVSRHTKSFIYATRVCGDRLSLLLQQPITQSDLFSHTTTNFKGGGLLLGKTITKQFPIYQVVPKCATMLDMLKQDRVIRNFVQDNLGFCVAPYRVNTVPVECLLPSLYYSPHYYVSDSLSVMQFAYDSIFPGQSTEEYSYDDYLFRQDELFFAVKEMIRLPTYEKFSKSCFDTLTPALRTSCPSPVTMDTKSVLKAFYDRNGDVPRLQGMVDDEGVADIMFNKFVDAYVKEKDIFDRFSEEPVHVNVDSIEDWLFTQNVKVRQTAFSDEFMHIFEKELNTYSMILKKLPKPKLETGAEYKFPSPQTIAHSSKDINAVFCPIVRELKKRLISVLHLNVVMFTDMSVSDFESLLTVRLSARQLDQFKYMFEADMAKYDKSQNLVALLFELRMLAALGFPTVLLPTWLYMHVFTKLVVRFLGIVFKIFYQRKSGDPMTYFGNTLLLMAVIAVLILDLALLIRKGFIFLLFSGDDFLAFCNQILEVLKFCHDAANSFNLEAKVVNFHTPYFCSKFLFMTPCGRWVMVPDVVKMLTKLGRRDLINELHVEEYRISCRDVGAHLGNSFLYPFIDAALADRYKLDPDVSYGLLYSAMFTCFDDKNIFNSLYFRKDFARIDDKRVFVRLNQF